MSSNKRPVDYTIGGIPDDMFIWLEIFPQPVKLLIHGPLGNPINLFKPLAPRPNMDRDEGKIKINFPPDFFTSSSMTGQMPFSKSDEELFNSQNIVVLESTRLFKKPVPAVGLPARPVTLPPAHLVRNNLIMTLGFGGLSVFVGLFVSRFWFGRKK